MNVLESRVFQVNDLKIGYSMLNRAEFLQSLHTDYGFPIPEDAPAVKIGIDPGSSHLGITFLPLTEHLIHIFQVYLPSIKNPLDSALNLQTAYRTCLLFCAYYLEELGFQGSPWTTGSSMVIEGPSYGERFGQAKLAESRISIALQQHHVFEGQVIYCPPKTIRKLVFDNGNIIAKVLWKEFLTPDAADSLACALAGVKLYAQNRE